jgi:predicted lipoprotein with Yx(FWY)xxD motif
MNRNAAIPLLILATAIVITVGTLNTNHHATAPPARQPLVTPTGPVVDTEGFLLYRFEQPPGAAQRRTDHRVDPLPEWRLLSCDGGTPSGWPLVSYRPDTALRGIDRALLGYLERADGRHQLTISGCPIYRYAGDHLPGQSAGQGIAGAWFTVQPAGDWPTLCVSNSVPVTFKRYALFERGLSCR